MISVDTVYQKVLALANKEQRGYITPQDFNLFANQAQLEVFEQYFYDINVARKNQGNDTVYADVDDMLEEKLQIFESFDDSTTVGGYTNASTVYTLPNYIYRIHRVEVDNTNAEILSTKDFNDCIQGGPLIMPTDNTLICNIRNNELRVAGGDGSLVDPTGVYYFRVPSRVNWTYVVINKQAMYDANSSTQSFELHSSEENNLVNKILTLAGVSNKQLDIMKAGQGMDMSTKQQQPKI